MRIPKSEEAYSEILLRATSEDGAHGSMATTGLGEGSVARVITMDSAVKRGELKAFGGGSGDC